MSAKADDGTSRRQIQTESRRQQLERRAVSAAIELLAECGGTAFLMRIPGSDPAVFVAVGDATTLRRMLPGDPNGMH